MEEEIVTQIGLLLSQLRYTRRALEDIERSTARYGGVTFAVALAAGPRFGEPPMLNGALKVYVTNINDLTISRGSVGLFEGILGGIGRFFGGLVGGFAGGVIGGISLWVWVGKLQEIVKGINDILDRLGIRGGATGGTPGGTLDNEGKPVGTDWVAAIERLNPMLKSLTALFDAASTGSKAAGKAAAENMSGDLSKEALAWGEQLAVTLNATKGTLDAVDKVVKGLIVFVPMLIGALATLLVRLDDIKLAILDLLQFAFRITLLLRGAALVTIYDTISAVARLGASILGILKDAVEKILNAVLAMIGSVFSTVEAFITFIGSGLKKAMDGLLDWLVGGLGKVLTYIGDLQIFRLLVHLVQVLPNLLPALVTLVHGGDASISDEGMRWLRKARTQKMAEPLDPVVMSKQLKEVKFPDVGKKLLEDVAPFKKSLEDAKTELPKQADIAFKAAQKGLKDIDATMQKALTTGETEFQTKMTKDLEKVGGKANELAKALIPDVKTSKGAEAGQGPDEGLRAIAKAYEGWMKGDGMKTVLEQISTYFAGAKATEPIAGPAVMPAAAVGAARPEPPKATVDIGELVIDLKPPKPEPGAKSSVGKLFNLFLENVAGYDEAKERGIP